MGKTLSVTVVICLGILFSVSGQEAEEASRVFKRVDIFPAINYAPETKLTLGAIGYYYLDLYRDDPATQLSNVQFVAVYTLANQIALEGRFELFTNGNRWRIRGETFYNKWPDRNYGIGNEAGVLVAEIEDGELDTLNYLQYTSDRLKLEPAAYRQISERLYLGLRADLEYLFNDKPLADRFQFLNADSTRITRLPVGGLRSGMGMQLLYDSRDYVLNPMKGTFLEAGSLHYGPWLGSDFTFHSNRVDARQYFNATRNHTFALRALVNFRFSEDDIPIRGLSRVGGRDF